MVAAHEGNHLEPVCVFPHEAQRHFVGFGSRAGEEGLLQRVRRDLGHLLGQQHLGRRDEGRSHLDDLVGLVAEGLYVLRVGMAQGYAQLTGLKIDEPPAFDVPHVKSIAAFGNQGRCTHRMSQQILVAEFKPARIRGG